MNHQHYQRKLGEDLAGLRRLLRRTLREAGAALPPAEEFHILNLACGACNEAEVLVETLPELFLRRGAAVPPRTSLVGVDVREREITDATARCRSWLRERSHRGADGASPSASPPPQFEFLAGDATKVGSHREIGEDFDVVFLRHQNFYLGEGTWRKIFDQGLEKLSDDGHLIFTSYFDREHELALQAFRDLGADIIATRENPEGRQLSTPGKVIDKHIAVIRKN